MGIVAFALGLIVGSFVNVCIYRLPRHESVVWPGSHCPHCQAAIRWFDNIPLLSFALLARGFEAISSSLAVTGFFVSNLY